MFSTKNLTFVYVLCFAALISAAVPVSGAPLLLNYQGTLLDNSQNPVSGTKTMAFKVYKVQSGGTPLWESANMNVTVVNGIFTVALSGFPETLFSEDNRYMGVFVDGAELAERKQIASVPYALGVTKTPYKARVWRNDYQSLPNEVLTKIQFNQKSYDPNNNFDMSTYRYTVPVTGYYLIQSKLGVRHMSQKISWSYILVCRNGEGIDIVTENEGSSLGSNFLQMIISDIYQLNQGDFIEIYSKVGTTDGSNAYINQDINNSTFSIHLMSQ